MTAFAELSGLNRKQPVSFARAPADKSDELITSPINDTDTFLMIDFMLLCLLWILIYIEIRKGIIYFRYRTTILMIYIDIISSVRINHQIGCLLR